MPTPRKQIKTPSVTTSIAHAFKAEWLARFGFSKAAWKSEAKAALSERPFIEEANVMPLLAALFGDVSRASTKAGMAPLCTAYAWFCFQAWQSGSHFPSFAENYAEELLETIRSGRVTPQARVIAELFVVDAKDSRCGFQSAVLANAAKIRTSETWTKAGAFEHFLKAKTKYEEFETKLGDSTFLEDWEKLKTAFPKETRGSGILHRTPLLERNWVRDTGASFRSRAHAFQSAFDLLCWKYCLWGVADGQPLLLKPSVSITPYGTQIMIPAYLSLDPSRDFISKAITKLHRARGVVKQGKSYTAARNQKKADSVTAYTIWRKARAEGLRGEAVYEFVANALKRLPNGEYAEIRRLIKEGREASTI